MVDLELLEIDVVDPVALGDGARELVLGDGAGLDEDVLDLAARCAGGDDRAVDGLGVDHPELDDHVAQEPGAPAGLGCRSDPLAHGAVPAPLAAAGTASPARSRACSAEAASASESAP